MTTLLEILLLAYILVSFQLVIVLVLDKLLKKGRLIMATVREALDAINAAADTNSAALVAAVAKLTQQLDRIAALVTALQQNAGVAQADLDATLAKVNAAAPLQGVADAQTQAEGIV